jgi:tetratricopeptide (TPR) repeat protein
MDDLWTAALDAHAQGNIHAAYVACEALLDDQPHHLGALQLMGVLALSLGEHKQALTFFEAVCALQPTNLAAAINRGTAYFNLEQYDSAEREYRRAIEIDTQSAEAWFNLGNTLKRLENFSEACGSFERCVSIRGNYQQAHYNWANTLHQMGRFVEAKACFDRALVLNPLDHEARKNRSFSRLMLGDFEGGWDDYESRWSTEPLNRAKRLVTYPLWTGDQPLNGRSILLHGEQGLGDTLQFSRYAPLVKAVGAAHVVLEVQPPLLRVVQGLKGVDAIVPFGVDSSKHDFHCPLMSLPRAFRTHLRSIPAGVPYLYSEPARTAIWANRISAGGIKVGICWSGSAKGKDLGKAIPLATFGALASVPSVNLYSLQKRSSDGEPKTIEEILELRQYDDLLDAEAPFVDTAALMTCLDLVVTADTSVAHLAGALGVPVWVALPWLCDWRWMHTGHTSPWYPTMRLFRQPSPGDWEGCFSLIRQALLDQLRTA